MALYSAGLVFLGQRWTVLGILGSALALATIFTTSMIYAQLRSVPRWNTPLTPAMFLSLSLAGGALLSGQTRIALVLIPMAGAALAATWIAGDRAFRASGTTLATATGLGARETVRAFEPPHTGTNYLLREFVHVVGRKHSRKLRFSVAILGFGVPFLLLLLPLGWPHVQGAAALLSHLGGVLVSRWLFFAEAEHVVGLYYGQR
jgi:DMSO reductase anchor subunit